MEQMESKIPRDDNNQPKIIDLISKYSTGVGSKKFMSVEISPNQNMNISDFERYNLSPLFYSVIWKNPKHLSLIDVSEETVESIPAFQLAQLLSENGKIVMMHITCVDMSYQTLYTILKKMQRLRIRNILALQGDGIASSRCKDLRHACDIIEYARKLFGNFFCFGVAGDPYCFDDPNYFAFLKQKVNTGVDFIITQIIYKSEDFELFVNKCKTFDIDIPILPGLYTCKTYNSLRQMESISGVKLPRELLEQTRTIQSDADAVTNVLNNFTFNLLKDLYTLKCVYGIHWFSVKKPKIFEYLYSFENIHDLK